jgi:Flp pilus assembly protein TadB
LTLSTQAIFPILAALSIAAIAYVLFSWLFHRRPSASRSLQDFSFVPAGADAQELRMGSQEHKIRFAFAGYGLNVTGKEQLSFYFAIAGLGLSVALIAASLNLPPLFWLGGPAMAYFAVNGLVTSKWNKVRLAIEKEIPSFLMNLSSVIQLNPNVLQALEDASLSLNPKGYLRPWVERLEHALQSRGQKGLEDMQAEAGDISSSLLLVVVEIGRLWETGGQGYAQSFQMVSENLSGILEGRSKAFAKADGAWGTIRVIVLALGGAIFLAFSNPGSGALFRTPVAQVAIVAAVAWAAFGWSYIGDLIRESVD